MLASQAQKYLPHLEEAHENLQGLLDHLAEDYHFKSSEQAWAALQNTPEQVSAPLNGYIDYSRNLIVVPLDPALP